MNAVAFDTLKYAETLKAAGIPQAQAEAQAHALSDVLHANLTELATKTDLNALEARLTAQIREIELRMTIKLGSMLVIAVGVIAALVKLL